MLNDKGEIVFNTPQWLLDEAEKASKEYPGVSLKMEFRKIYEAKARGEDPRKTVYGMSDEDIEKYSLTKMVDGLRIQQMGERPHRREEQSHSPSDEDVGSKEEVSSRGKLGKRKASASFGEQDIASARKGFRPFSVAASPAIKTSVAESSKSGAARRPSANTPPKSPVEQPSVVDVYQPKALPGWYTKLDLSTVLNKMKRPTQEQSQAWNSLKSLKDCIRRCEDAVAKKPADLSKEIDELRDHVHKADIMLKGVDKYVVRKANMLAVNNHDSLPRIFMARNVHYPWDLRADAWQLYYRWYNEDFKNDLLRGIITRKGKDRASDSIDPAWEKDGRKRPANYHGQGHLVLGQWWPTQLCAVRDGAHGAAQGGIYGSKGEGAYSVVLSGGGGYKDRDEGDVVWYSGTDSKTGTVTENTQRLIESCDEYPDRPVRLLRSAAQQLSKSQYRPSFGLRYDGLYKVVNKELLDENKQEYLFKLVRCPNQNPIRYGNNSARRPTVYEENEYNNLKKNGRWTG